MTNAHEEEIVDVPELTPEQDEEGNDTTDWKALAEARHAEAVKYQGMAKRFKTKSEKAKETPASPIARKEQPESEELSDGELALFAAKGYEDDKVLELAQSLKKKGLKARDIIKDEYFLHKAKQLAKEEEVANATPKTVKRTGSVGRDEADYWLEKIEAGTAKLSDITSHELKSKVVNLRIKRNEEKSNF